MRIRVGGSRHRLHDLSGHVCVLPFIKIPFSIVMMWACVEETFFSCILWLQLLQKRPMGISVFVVMAVWISKEARFVIRSCIALLTSCSNVIFHTYLPSIFFIENVNWVRKLLLPWLFSVLGNGRKIYFLWLQEGVCVCVCFYMYIYNYDRFLKNIHE